MLQSQSKVIDYIIENMGSARIVSKKESIWDFATEEGIDIPKERKTFLYYKNRTMKVLVYPTMIILYKNGSKNTIRLSKSDSREIQAQYRAVNLS